MNGLQEAPPYVVGVQRTKEYFQTDAGNAEMFADFWESHLIYVGDQWYREHNGLWTLAKDAYLTDRATEAVRSGAITNLTFARQSESEKALNAMIRLARGQMTRDVRFDRQSELFNVPNGTLDLRTGELREHDPYDYLTKMSPVPYRPMATSNVWEDFLQDVTGQDPALQRYLQTVAGLCLIGSMKEKAFFLVKGPQNSGKSTYLNMLCAIMGDYAAPTIFAKAFSAKSAERDASPFLYKVMDKRLVVCSEIKPGLEISVDLVKQLTGLSDKLTLRDLYGSSAPFDVNFKVMVAANDNLGLSPEDDALWTRIKHVPFLNSIPPERQNPDLFDALTNPEREAPAVLAWAVEGAKRWYVERLQEPEIVTRKTAELRQDADPLADWLEDCTLMEPDAWVEGDRLRDSYLASLKGGEKPLLGKAFTAALMANRKVEREKRNGIRGFRGIRLGLSQGI